MTESFVLRLVTRELEQGRLVGEVECVATRQREPLRDAEDLVDFCRRQAAPPMPDLPRPRPTGRPTPIPGGTE